MKLYSHQVTAIDKMKNGCVLCGGVGSGKSITALTYYMTKVCDGRYFEGGDTELPNSTIPLYIITTARKRDSKEWDSELSRWCLSTNGDISWLNTKVVVDSWNNITKYLGVKDAFCIFDEQRVVGYGSWSKTFIKIAKCNRWIMLSATPGDSWVDYMSVFIANGFYKHKTDFYNKHVVVKWNQMSAYPKIERYDNIDLLIRHRDDILVDMKFDRTTTPHHIDIYCDYDKERYKYVNKEKRDIFYFEETGKEKPLNDISAVIRVLRHIVNIHNSRTKELMNIYKKHGKIIIFYNFNYERDILREWCSSYNIVYKEWNGSIHEDIPTDEKWVYLVQYTAGAEGWNCTTCNTIVFYSQSYSYKQTAQACGRIDRLNTKYSDLYYYHFTSKSSIDIVIKKTLDRKEEFNEAKASRDIFKEEDEDPFESQYKYLLTEEE